ncbi:MAG: DUF1667 domain-containing protein [Gracilibacteraceae bacterium]|jgi:CxxC motif-containing protein|nr:DUF1667 domain-containing protein [Gracilibacteraceae bacterium]
MIVEKEIQCVICPAGCELRLFCDATAAVLHRLEGAACAKGREFAERELTDPRRTLTSTVKVRGGRFPLVSVRSAAPLPKHILPAAVAMLGAIWTEAPVAAGQIILADIMGAGIALVATEAVERKKNDEIPEKRIVRVTGFLYNSNQRRET